MRKKNKQVRQRNKALNILFFLFVAHLDDAGEGDGECTGKLGCPGQEPKYMRSVSTVK